MKLTFQHFRHKTYQPKLIFASFPPLFSNLSLRSEIYLKLSLSPSIFFRVFSQASSMYGGGLAIGKSPLGVVGLPPVGAFPHYTVVPGNY